MNLYLDTSALVKLFHDEPGSPLISELVDDRKNSLWILDLARVEYRCQLFRKIRNRELKEEDLASLTEDFDLVIRGFHVERMSSAIVDEALRLLDRLARTKGLRTLDALHLAAFCALAEGADWRFVTSDEHLFSCVQELGYAGILP